AAGGAAAGPATTERVHESSRVPEREPSGAGSGPADGARPALLVAGRGLDADHGPGRELLEGRGARVGHGAAHARGDLVHEVLHAGALGVEVHLGAGDALLEESL